MKRSARRKDFRRNTVSIFWLCAGNFAITIFISSGYFGHVEAAGWEWLLVALVHVSQYGAFWLAMALPLWGLLALSRLIGRPRLFTPSAIILSVIPQALLCFDMYIYRLFRYHVNGLVLDVIFEEALGESVHLGFGTISTATGLVAAIAVALWALIRYGEAIRSLLHFPRSLRQRLWIAGTIVASFLVDKSMYAYGDLFNRTNLLKYSRIFPLYITVTIKDFAQRHLGMKLEQAGRLEFASGKSLLKYPPLSGQPCSPSGERPNFLVIILDSWRFDMVNSELTPNIMKFREGAWDFRYNFSGGNATRYGVFSIMYGIHATYWEPFLAERRGTVMIDALKSRGYAFKVISSTKLNFPEFRRTAFAAIPGSISDALGGERPSERDRRQPGVLFDFIDKERAASQPFLAVLYFDCPHSPYDFPDEFTRFTPVAKEVNYLKVVAGTDITHINRYKNGLYFDDHLVGRILAGLEERGLAQSTVVFITSDHGEEFWESGYWGHTNAFTRQQARVPLLLRIPGRAPKIHRGVTTNLDIVPTVLDLAGCGSLIPEYTLGHSLLSPVARDHWVVTGYQSLAVYTRDRILSYSVDLRNAPEMVVRTHDYKPVPESSRREEMRKMTPYLRKVLEEQRRLLK